MNDGPILVVRDLPPMLLLKEPVEIKLEMSQAPGATGPQGPAGVDGAPGADGAQGPQGPQGLPGQDSTPKSLTDHGVVGAGSEDFSAGATHHKVTATGSHSWTFSGFAEAQPEISIRLTVSGGGAPTITLPGAATIASDSAQTLAALVDGVYLVEVVTFDAGASYAVLVAAVS